MNSKSKPTQSQPQSIQPNTQTLAVQTSTPNHARQTKIDVNIIVEYGVRIPDVAFEIQNKVKKSVEEKTGLKVSGVNVHIQGVKTEINEPQEIIVDGKNEEK